MTRRSFFRRVRSNTPAVVRGLYISSVFLVVLQFGAVRPFPITMSAVFSAIVALLSLIVFGGPVRARWLFVTFVLLGTVTFAWVWAQSLTSLPPSFDNALWSDLSLASLPAKGSIAISPADSIEALLFVAVPLLAFLTGLIVIRSDDDARVVINSLAIGGGLCALYGLIQVSFFPNTNLFFPKVFYVDSLTATFVNRNTAGTFLGIAALVTFRYAWSLGKQISVMRIVRRLLQNRNVETAGLSTFLIVAFLFACAAMALMLTKSRGATASSLAAFGLLFYFLFVRKGAFAKAGFSASSGGMKTFVRILGVLLVIVVGFSVFGGRTLLRAESQGGDDGRYCVLPGIVELAKGEPVYGYGFGSFLYAFPPFRDPACGISGIWDRAHNVFLEGFIGLGILFPALVLIGGGAVIIAHIIGIRERRRMRSYAVMGLAGIVVIGLHSLVDFSIQIPGFAAYAAALLAATSSISLAKSAPSTASRKRTSVRSSA